MTKTLRMSRARRLNGFMGKPVENGNLATYMVGPGKKFNDASVTELGKTGMMICADCTAMVDYTGELHNKDGSLRQKSGFVAKRKHDIGCDIAEDPKHVASRKKMRVALREGRRVLIELEFPTTPMGSDLKRRFEALAKGEANGLWEMRAWEGGDNKYALVHAWDVQDLLSYMAVAHRYKDNAKRHLVFIRADGIVQSYDRFMDSKIESVVADAIALSKMKSDNTRDVRITTPARLFRISASKSEMDKFNSKTGKSEALFSGLHTIHVPTASGKPEERRALFGVRMKHITNHQIITSGRDFMVVAAPSMSGEIVRDMKMVGDGQASSHTGESVFVNLNDVTPDHIAHAKKNQRKKAHSPQARAA